MELSYEMSPSEMLVNITGTTTSLDDFYPSVAIATLMKIIRDPTQVYPLNSFFLCLLFLQKITYLPGGQINDPSSGKNPFPSLLSPTPQSQSRTLEGLFEVTQRPSKALNNGGYFCFQRLI